MDALAIASLAMQDDLQRVNSISQNLANVSTTGYKREIPVSGRFDQHLRQAGAPSLAHDHSSGTLRTSASTLDLAIDGPGYFEVQTEHGLAYTRAGSLHVDARSRLVTAGGAVLNGVGGELVVTNAPLSIDPQGQVQQGERSVGQIKVVRFSNPDALVAIGNGLYGAGQAAIDQHQSGGQVRAGYLENANVSSAREMVHLSETMRHFEAMQKIIQGHDDAFDKAVRKLGDF